MQVLPDPVRGFGGAGKRGTGVFQVGWPVS
jgi:hypothetical protein